MNGRGYNVLPCPSAVSWDETGTTFKENALIKAKAVQDSLAGRVGFAIASDDSGLVVPALGGAPGVYSARYAGPDASDEDNNQKLLQVMAAQGLSRTKAYFVTEICLIRGEEIVYFGGEIHGEIVTVPSGSAGFGYDPYFYVPSVQKSMADLSLAEKNTISHRALALQKMLRYLKPM